MRQKVLLLYSDVKTTATTRTGGTAVGLFMSRSMSYISCLHLASRKTFQVAVADSFEYGMLAPEHRHLGSSTVSGSEAHALEQYFLVSLQTPAVKILPPPWLWQGLSISSTKQLYEEHVIFQPRAFQDKQDNGRGVIFYHPT